MITREMEKALFEDAAKYLRAFAYGCSLAPQRERFLDAANVLIEASRMIASK